MPAYFQQYFVTVPESHKYESVHIMLSLKESNTGKAQVLDIFT